MIARGVVEQSIVVTVVRGDGANRVGRAGRLLLPEVELLVVQVDLELELGRPA